VAIERVHANAAGSWRVTTASELLLITHANHGDEAYVADESRWYKFAAEQWQRISPGPAAAQDEVYETADGDVIRVEYTGLAWTLAD
jgi:hypothetical protein